MRVLVLSIGGPAVRTPPPFFTIVFPLGHLQATAMAIAELTVAEDRDVPSSGKLVRLLGWPSP